MSENHRTQGDFLTHTVK